MLPREILKQIRRLHVRARRAVQDLLGGEYHSVFKGPGFVFEEVREYLPGDDVRAIDWNVTARMGHPYIKRFIEERDLTVLLLLDCSGSTGFGTVQQRKREVAAEMAALLAFSAISNNDKVGLIAFTDQVERYLPPRKGTRHALRLIRDVLFFQPSRPGTVIKNGLDFLNRVRRRKAIVFLFSDFLDGDYERALRQTARRHDLIMVHLADPREQSIPSVGFMEVVDAETGQRMTVDTGSNQVREAFAVRADQRKATLNRLARSTGADLIEASTQGGHLDALIRFFQMRERRLKRV